MTAPALILTALATSGLRPNFDQPLELGLLAVNRETYDPIDILTIVLQADPTSVLSSCDEFVASMHSSNGLFDELVNALPAKFPNFDAAAKDAAIQAVDFIERNGATGGCRSPLICFNTDWNRRWLATRFGNGLIGHFYNELDLTTLLYVTGRTRTKGDGRVESTLTEALSALCSLKQIAP